jgi:peptide subunit release factor 1 (eRF1)
MTTTPAVHATTDNLKRLIQLARSPHPFLSIYLPTDPAQTSTEGIRLRILARLDDLANDLAGTPLEEPLAQERKVVEEYIRSIRPGGLGLAIISSLAAQDWAALWLPGPVEEHVRFGTGAYVLPLMDLLDEWEPVALAMVERDKARLMVFEGGQIEEVRHLEEEVPGQHRAGGGTATHYQSGVQAYPGQHTAGGGASARFQRHIQVHADRLYNQVVQELGDFQRQRSFRRLFIAGSSASVAQFKSHLPNPLKELLAGGLTIDAHASDQEVMSQVLQAAREVERQEEVELVQEIVTRAEKGQGAVTGTAPSLWALNRHQMHLLVLAGESPGLGGYCANCEILLPPEDIVCPQCDQKPQRVDLWEELPGFALRRGVRIEIVHGEAASSLWHHQSIGGLLKPVQH